MKATTSLYLMLFLFVLMPVLDILGHFINLAEFYIYASFFINLKKIKKNPLVVPFIVYIVLFILTVILTASLAGQSVNNYDIFVFRHALQLILLIYLMNIYIHEIKSTHDDFSLNQVILNCFYILSLPALIVYFQRADFFYARKIIETLYKPQFFFLKAEEFSSFRYTSVFKDFFTSAVYFTFFVSGMFYFFLKASLSKRNKIIIIMLIVFNYIAQFFVARTSQVMIPLTFVVLLIFGVKGNALSKLKRIIAASILLLPFYFFILFQMSTSETNPPNEGNKYISFTLENAILSYEAGHQLIMNFYNYVLENPRILFVPNHEYDLTLTKNPLTYSDSFYPQEIYRYGLYGIVIYFLLLFLILKISYNKSRGVSILVILLAFLNYKGGNTFFLPRNIYMYAFIFTLIYLMDLSLKEKVQ